MRKNLTVAVLSLLVGAGTAVALLHREAQAHQSRVEAMKLEPPRTGAVLPKIMCIGLEDLGPPPEQSPYNQRRFIELTTSTVKRLWGDLKSVGP
ncbi:hypothetical protein FJV41_11985 [Myxococcus llanfairpwllgwyngyllgogerychwyrndrobwllllantysiliogogogochensis]|uniref:Uncharacterized protein n=1 Tax=Myxococcus llanfairpwllgwyngyllgogerychwyrndrobwllllantysiliogogogochensis TaxID=2590453 RepID=A0A540X373_9BACT|nr:hypothetical protein [Myxococcus llanfairpwllgwyngyllgogerychwyrndrobwllllantysiliogogogochensis]TQF15707.1 hypothetical protein FJV41_11985 [Myxococcus llanfairpwllgwyngyllgogerychwyrndrobwllllantysiliogogogochensis]